MTKREQLIVDVLLLEAVAIDVGRIHSEFTNATERSERLGDAVGHAALAERVEAFAANWDQRRKELSEQLDTVHKHLDTVVEGFRTTDEELAKALAKQDASYPPRTAPQKTK